MRITFLLWGQVRLAAGTSTVEIDLPEGETLDGALEAFFSRHQDLAPHRSSTRAAIGNEYAAGDRRIRPGDEISLIPPVQGG